MIQPQPAQRGPIAEQHGLAKLTSTLDALSQGQREQQTRDTHLQAQLATVAQQCATQAQALTSLRTWGQRLVLAIAGLTVLALGLCGAVVWQVWHPPALAYVRAVGALDQVLVQQWNTLPKATQEQLRGTYERLGLTSPGQRK